MTSPAAYGEGIPGDGEPHVFSNLLISIYVYVGSNVTVRPGHID